MVLLGQKPMALLAVDSLDKEALFGLVLLIIDEDKDDGGERLGAGSKL